MPRRPPQNIVVQLCGVTGWLAAGCTPTATPWTLPAPGGPPECWQLTMLGGPVGAETRWRHDGVEQRRRTWRLRVDDQDLTVDTELRLRLAEDGAVRLLERLPPGGTVPTTTTIERPAWLPDTLQPLAGDRAVPILDTWSGTIEVTSLTETAERRGSDGWSVLLEDGRPTGWVHGALGGVRADCPVPLPDRGFDLIAALALEVPTLPGARSSRRATYVLDGTRHVVEVPIRAELPRSLRTTLDHLTRGVRADLVASPTPGRGSALSALRLGRGDCTEHAALFVERATTLQLTARPVEGLVYTDEPVPSFVPHAWAEVALGDVWIPVDPSLDQVPADATHLPLRDAGDRLRTVTHAGKRTLRVEALR